MKIKGKNVILICAVWAVAFGLLGCEAFVRKFTRKSKKENLPKEEMVLTPVEYKAPEMTKEELYRKYFLYWKSWHDELIESLSREINHKKQLSCIAEALENLEQLKNMLKDRARKNIDVFINRLSEAEAQIKNDIYGANAASYRVDLERIKRGILRDLSYGKIKDDLI